MTKPPAIPFAPRTALRGRPAALAAAGDQVLVADRRGTILFWNWPDQTGPAFAAHGDGGPVTAVGGDFGSSGGWDSHLIRWDAHSFSPRFVAQPFSGRITALCGQGDALLVAGADRANLPGSPADDAIALLPGRVKRVDRAGSQSDLTLPVIGQISALACDTGWVAALDDGTSDLAVLRGTAGQRLVLSAGPAMAIAAHDSDLIVADRGGIWSFRDAGSSRRELARFGPGSPRVLGLLAHGDALFGITSRGVLRWPGGQPFTRAGGGQALALASYHEHILVLWEDGTLEERDPHTGAVLHEAGAPQE